jgi:FkbM family methyltransferase
MLRRPPSYGPDENEMNPIFDNPPVRIRACRHGVMMFLTNDMIGRSLDLYGEFSEDEMRAFEALIPVGATVIDVGANVGTHTLAFSRMVGPAGRVVSFEPQRTIHNLLCGNLAMNRAGNVQAFHAAVGAALGVVRTPPIDYVRPGYFNFGALALGDASAYPPGGETVSLVTLDSLALERCDLVTIDVEGMELAVLSGAQAMLRRTGAVLYLENNREANSPALLAWLLGAGYRCYWHLTRYFAPENFFGATENVFPDMVEVNVIAVPAGRTADTGGLDEIHDPAALPSGTPGRWG